MATADEILAFWLGAPARDEAAARAKVQRWFAGGDALDREIRERFADDVERGLRGDLDAWERTPRELLALVLLIDQFPRSIFRDTPRAWAGDAKALALAEHAFAAGFDRDLDWEGRHFLTMPFLHAESAAAQARGVELMRRWHAECPEANRAVFAAGVEQAEKYAGVIHRFGRFPHRNAVLGRAARADEIEFLRDWDAKARPAIMHEPPRDR